MVIAVRGTLNHHDWGVNVDTLLGCGRQRHSCRIAMVQAESLVRDHGKESNFWLCGHSLWAAVATYVGEQMAIKGHFFTTFLFNTPYILNRRPKDGFLQKLNDIRAVAGDLVGGLIAGEVERVFELATLAMIFLDNMNAGDPAALATNLHDNEKQDQLQQFDNLNKWDARVYVNPKDLLCSRYIEYFEKKMKGSPEKLPKKIVVINLDEPEDELLQFEEAYLIMQWMDNPGDGYPRFKESNSIMQWWKPDLWVKAKRYVMA